MKEVVGILWQIVHKNREGIESVIAEQGSVEPLVPLLWVVS